MRDVVAFQLVVQPLGGLELLHSAQRHQFAGVFVKAHLALRALLQRKQALRLHRIGRVGQALSREQQRMLWKRQMRRDVRAEGVEQQRRVQPALARPRVQRAQEPVRRLPKGRFHHHGRFARQRVLDQY